MLYSYMLWLTPVWSLFPGLSPLVMGLRLILKYYITGFLSTTVLLSHTGLPTVAAAAAWRYAEKYPRLFLFVFPSIGAAFFIAHVGLTADAWFAAFWVVLPLAYPARAHLIGKAVIASLTAHIIGTLVVAFFGGPVAWATLVPLVAFERCVAAAGILFVAVGMNYCRKLMTHYALRSAAGIG